MTDSDNENDPTWHPPTDSESETETETEEEGCCCCCCHEDTWFRDTGNPEEAMMSGLMSMVAVRKHLQPDHIPLYMELLRGLLDEANNLYK
mgnify:FL=1